VRGGKGAGVGFPFRGELAGAVFVALQVVDANLVEYGQEAFPHGGVGQAIQPGVVGDEADHALAGVFDDLPFGHAEEAHIKVVEALALRLRALLGLAVGVAEAAFFLHRHAGIAVVGRVAEDDEDFFPGLDLVGGVAFGGQFGVGQHFVLRLLGRFPAGQGVGEVDPDPLVPGFRVVFQRAFQAMQEQAELQVGDHEGGGQQFEAEDAGHGGALEVVPGEGAAALAFQTPGDGVEDFQQVGAGAATGVQHHHAGVGQAIGDAQFLAQGLVHPRDLVAHDFARGVPDAELLAQFRVERFQEGFVEVLHRVFHLEAGEEGGGIHPAEGVAGPVQHFGQAHRFQLAGLRELVVEGGDHRHVQVVSGHTPIEAARRALLMAQHPGGEDAVEQGLYQGGAEEVFAFTGFEFDPEGGFQALLEGGELFFRRRRGMFHPVPGFAGIAGEQPGEILGVAQGRVMAQHAGEEIGEGRAVFFLRLVRMVSQFPEGGFAAGQGVALQVDPLAVALADEQPVAQIGDQHQAVAGPVFVDLRADGGVVHRLGRGFDFDDAARRGGQVLRLAGLAVELVLGEQAAIRVARAQVLELHDRPHLGLEPGPHRVEQIVQRRVIGSLPGTAAGGAHGARGLEEVGEFAIRFRHGFPSIILLSVPRLR